MTHHLTILTGASRGMGLALAEQLLSPNARLLCISRHASPALAERAAQCGATLEQWTMDLADSVPVALNLTGSTPFSQLSPFGRSGRFVYARATHSF